MSERVETNKQVLRRWIEIVNEAALDKMPEVFAEDVVIHAGTGLGTAKGLAEIGMIFAPMVRAFPQLRLTIEDLVGEDDKVASRVTARGAQQDQYFGFPNTGKEIAIAIFGIYRFKDGKIVEMWGVDDVLSLLDQTDQLPGRT